MGVEASNITKDLEKILGRSGAENNGNKWANFIELFEKIVLLIEKDKEVLGSSDRPPDDVTIGRLTNILDDFINKFRNDLFRWVLHSYDSDLRWGKALKSLDKAINEHLSPNVIDDLSKYRQWRRRYPNADELECPLSKNRHESAREIQKFTDALQIAVFSLKRGG